MTGFLCLQALATLLELSKFTDIQTVRQFMGTKVSEHDSITGETIVRDMTADELAQRKIDEAEAAKLAKAEAAKQAARQAVLDKLGLTSAEATALLG